LILLTLAVPMLMVLGCSNAVLKGDYGIHLTGMAMSGPFAGPIALVGVISFDGATGTGP